MKLRVVIGDENYTTAGILKDIDPEVLHFLEDGYSFTLSPVLGPDKSLFLLSMSPLMAKSETSINSKLLAKRIVAEKIKHTSVISKAYDTGEPSSMEEYTNEVEDVVQRVIAALGGTK